MEGEGMNKEGRRNDEVYVTVKQKQKNNGLM